jgi:hypothetical protein
MFFLLWSFQAGIICGGDETLGTGKPYGKSAIIRSKSPKLQSSKETLLLRPEPTYKKKTKKQYYTQVQNMLQHQHHTLVENMVKNNRSCLSIAVILTTLICSH